MLLLLAYARLMAGTKNIPKGGIRHGLREAICGHATAFPLLWRAS